MITITHLEDVEEARELHSLSFPMDNWVGDDHTFWVARDAGKVVGFCSAIHWDKRHAVFMSRAAVIKSAQGVGLHKRMIAHRVKWTWEQGIDRVCTYTTLQNYPSLINLLDCGFRFYKPDDLYAGKRYHYLQLVRK